MPGPRFGSRLNRECLSFDFDRDGAVELESKLGAAFEFDVAAASQQDRAAFVWFPNPSLSGLVNSATKRLCLGLSLLLILRPSGFFGFLFLPLIASFYTTYTG